jgi:hypothetical protein
MNDIFFIVVSILAVLQLVSWPCSAGRVADSENQLSLWKIQSACGRQFLDPQPNHFDVNMPIVTDRSVRKMLTLMEAT